MGSSRSRETLSLQQAADLIVLPHQNLLVGIPFQVNLFCHRQLQYTHFRTLPLPRYFR